MHRKKFGNTAKLIRTERFSTALREIADRNFLLLTLINFFVMLTYYLQFVISADYARSAYGLDLGMAGLSAGIIVLGCLLGRFASGNFVSTLGCRLMLFIGLSGYALSMAAFFCIHSWQALFGQRLVMGIFSGITATALGTIIACIVPARHQGLGIGIFSSSTVLALAFGPFLGMLLMPVCSYGNMVGASVIIAGMCVPCVLFVKNFAEPCKWHRPAFKLNSYIDTRVALFQSAPCCSAPVTVVCRYSCRVLPLNAGWGHQQASFSFAMLLPLWLRGQ